MMHCTVSAVGLQGTTVSLSVDSLPEGHTLPLDMLQGYAEGVDAQHGPLGYLLLRVRCTVPDRAMWLVLFEMHPLSQTPRATYLDAWREVGS